MNLELINQLFDEVVAAQNQTRIDQESRQLRPLIENGTLLGAYADDDPKSHFQNFQVALLTDWETEVDDPYAAVEVDLPTYIISDSLNAHAARLDPHWQNQDQYTYLCSPAANAGLQLFA